MLTLFIEGSVWLFYSIIGYGIGTVFLPIALNAENPPFPMLTPTFFLFFRLHV
jgi:hypothetical protein